MFLHLGNDFSVRVDDVVSVHDYACICASKDGRVFLSSERNKVEDISGGRPRSAVVTKDCIYLSRLSPGTLEKRSHTFWNIRDLMSR